MDNNQINGFARYPFITINNKEEDVEVIYVGPATAVVTTNDGEPHLIDVSMLERW